jgi:hypothetical protein
MVQQQLLRLCKQSSKPIRKEWREGQKEGRKHYWAALNVAIAKQEQAALSCLIYSL